jgi:hypothetical protein
MVVTMVVVTIVVGGLTTERIREAEGEEANT